MRKERGRFHLVLDLGGVIVDHDNIMSYDRLIALLTHRPPRSEIESFIAASHVGRGKVRAQDLFEQLRERYGSDASPEQFLAAWTCHFTLKADVFGLLEQIAEERPLVLCSNTNAAHWDYLDRRYRLSQLAANSILSHECGYEKPAPEIYLLAAAAHGADPEECLFVDDAAVNVAAAKSLGFQTHQFVGYDAFRRALEETT
jgi:putative hydrolase of the HAD superfamily